MPGSAATGTADLGLALAAAPRPLAGGRAWVMSDRVATYGVLKLAARASALPDAEACSKNERRPGGVKR